MGRKGKAKAKKVKRAKAIAKKNNKAPKLKDVTAAVTKADAQGIDVGSLAESALSGIPFVGPLLGNVVGQSITSATGETVGQRGGVRGVQLIDPVMGNLGVISRRKALAVLYNRGKRPPRKSKPTFIQVPQGQSVVRV